MNKKSQVKKQYFGYLKKNPLSIVLMIFLFTITIFIVIFFMLNGFPAFRVLYLFSRWNFYFCLIIATFVYYLFTAAIRTQCAETIDSIANKRYAWQKGVSGCLSVVGIVYHFVLIGMLLYCSIQNDGNRYFLTFFPRAYLMNIFLPQLIFIGVAYVCSCIAEKSKMISLSMLVFFYIMTSPLLDNLIWREKPSGFPVDQVVNKVRWLFSILYQNAQWAPDTQYGLQTEQVRLYLQICWILLLVGIMLFKGSKKKVMGAICAICSLVLLVVSYLPSSLYRLNESWDGIAADLSYYSDVEFEPRDMETPSYEFSNYDLELSIKNKLRVKGELTLSSNQIQKEFVFTLYHGYKVKELMVEGNDVTFIQEGDQVFLSFKSPIQEAKIMIEYEGASGKFYSNSQGIMLPGYFPWYPMAGDKQVFLQYSYYNGGNGTNPYNRISGADFTVKIDTSCDYVTNLEQQKEHLYAGKSDSLTIIGGNITSTGENQIINFLPLDLSEIEEKTYLANMKQKWETVIEELNTIYGLEVDQLRAKKIILCSKDIGRNFSNNYFAEFEDYLLVADVYLDSGTYINYLLYGHKKDSKLGELLSWAALSCEGVTAQDVIDKMMESEHEQAEMVKSMDGEEVTLDVAEQLKQVQEKIGSSALLKEIVQYLLSDLEKTDELFLESLLVKYK